MVGRVAARSGGRAGTNASGDGHASPDGAATHSCTFQLDLNGAIYDTELTSLPATALVVKLPAGRQQATIEHAFSSLLRCHPGPGESADVNATLAAALGQDSGGWSSGGQESDGREQGATAGKRDTRSKGGGRKKVATGKAGRGVKKAAAHTKSGGGAGGNVRKRAAGPRRTAATAIPKITKPAARGTKKTGSTNLLLGKK